jgi:choline-sulfatase
MRPNILHLFADQFRADCIGALGHSVVRTPNLDRLCAEGIAFTNAFSPSPVCVPARACMVYGRYPAQTGCYNNAYSAVLNESESFMQSLTASGYRTHGIGKCHFTPDLYALRGFQTRETSEEIFPDPCKDDYAVWLHREGYNHITEIHGVRGEMYYIPQIAQMPASHHPTQWVGDRASAFVREQHGDAPWYLFASFIHPHPPFAPPVPWHKLYRALDMPLPQLPVGYEALQTFINRFQNRYKYRDRGLDLNLIRCLRAAYYACISFIDFQIGRILDALKKTGQFDNTLIVFSSDHGELLGDYVCFGKRSMHDASVRIPMIARYPLWFEKGARCDHPVSLIDLAPTFLQAGEVVQPSSLPGLSLREVPDALNPREFVFSQFETEKKALYMAVSNHWKYVYSAPDQREFVFDRWNDPGETREIADLSENESTTVRLRGVLQNFLRQNQEFSNLDPESPTGWKRRSLLTMPADPDEGLLIQDPEWANFSIPGYSNP